MNREFKSKKMILAKVFLLALSGFRIVNAFDFPFVWYEGNSTTANQYQPKEPEENAENATRINVMGRIPILLRSFDLSFVKHLDVIHIEGCEIADIEPGVFKTLPSVMNLSLSKNFLKHIKDGIFNNVNIQHLDLSHNRLTTIKPSAFNDMPNLTSISLDYNELTSYGLLLENCPKLSTVSVQYNFVQYLPEGIFKNHLDKTLSVYFSYNKISKIDPDLFDVKEFKDLYLDHNEIGDLENVLNKIDTLSLNVNDLDCFSDTFLHSELFKVKKVLLFENPLNCSCYNEIIKLKNVLLARPEGC